MSSKLDRLIASYQSMECEFNVDKSIEVCKEILKINPNLIEFQENLAFEYYNKKEYEKSIELFNKCIENGSTRDDSYMMIALSYVKLNNPEKALEIIKDTKDKENYLLNHFLVYKELEEYDKAIAYGDKLLELNPENTLALHHMSDIYDKLDDEERSLFYFTEMSTLYPEIKSILLMRLYSLGKYDEIIESFEELKAKGMFETDLESAHFNFIIGMSYYELKRHYDSLKYLINSDRIYPTVDKKTAIARNYIDLYEFNNAYKYLREGLEMEPLNYTLLFLMVETNYFRKEHIQAIDYANTLLKNYENEDIYRVLAAIFFDMGEIKEGWKCIYAGSTPEDYKGDHIFKITDILSKSNQSERALNIFRIIEEKIPEFPFTYIERAKHYKRLGEMDLAKKDLKKYNELWFGDECSFEDL